MQCVSQLFAVSAIIKRTAFHTRISNIHPNTTSMQGTVWRCTALVGDARTPRPLFAPQTPCQCAPRPCNTAPVSAPWRQSRRCTAKAAVQDVAIPPYTGPQPERLVMQIGSHTVRAHTKGSTVAERMHVPRR